jgi:hypothetical protein
MASDLSPDEDAPMMKPFRVYWIGDKSAALDAFDSLEEAIAFIRTLRLDRHHVVYRHRTIVWPPPLGVQ